MIYLRNSYFYLLVFSINFVFIYLFICIFIYVFLHVLFDLYIVFCLFFVHQAATFGSVIQRIGPALPPPDSVVWQ